MSRAIGSSQLVSLLGAWRQSGGPAYEALATAVHGLILDGRLPVDARLPAERDAAAALRVSRTTVAAAYVRLRDAGYLRSRRGSGSWTALPATAGPVGWARPTDGWQGGRPADGWQGGRPADGWSRDPSQLPGVLDLATAALPAPRAALAAAIAYAAEHLDAYTVGHGYDPVGTFPLRQAIADAYNLRGLATSPADILVTAGAQSAFALVLRVLAGPGDRVVVESPTYPNALDAVSAAGGRLVPVAMTDTGWDVPMIAATLRQTAPRLLYLIPDFQNPTGHLMSDADRVAVVAAARRVGAYVVVDESFVDIVLDDHVAPAPMAAYDTDGRVLSIGSMSKSFWGGLRIGWIRAAAPLVARLAAARASIDMGTPIVEQLMAVHLLGMAGAMLPARCADLAIARDTVLSALAEQCPGWSARRPAGGVTLWVRLDGPVSGALAFHANRFGLRLAAGPRFGTDGTLEGYLRVPFTLPPADLTEAVTRLAALARSVGPGTRTADLPLTIT